MKKPTNDKIITDISLVPLNLDPGESSWGEYQKGLGWTSAKVFTGKAVRQWILNKFKNILNLLNKKLEPSNIIISDSSPVVPLGKKLVLKNRTVTIQALDGTLKSFNTIILVEEDTSIYPNVWFKGSDEEITDIMEIIDETSPNNSSNSYNKSINTKHYYVIVLGNYLLVEVTNSLGSSYLNLFLLDEINGYKIYHYSRVVAATVNWTFKIN